MQQGCPTEGIQICASPDSTKTVPGCHGTNVGSHSRCLPWLGEDNHDRAVFKRYNWTSYQSGQGEQDQLFHGALNA